MSAPARATDAQMLKKIELWKEETGSSIIDFEAFSKWAIENKHYSRPPITAEKQCEMEARKAVRQAHHFNPQGIRVRTYRTFPYAYKGEQLQLQYVDVRTSAPDIMEKSFDHDYTRIENFVKRHSIEKHSYDDNNLFGATLPGYNYDFNVIAANARMTGEYDDSYEEEDPIVEN